MKPPWEIGEGEGGWCGGSLWRVLLVAVAPNTCAHEATSGEGTEPWDWVQLHAVPEFPENVVGVAGEVAVASSEPRMRSSEAVSPEAGMMSSEPDKVSSEPRMASSELMRESQMTLMLIAAAV